MNTRLTDAELAAVARYDRWHADAEEGRAEAASAVSDQVDAACTDDGQARDEELRGMTMLVGATLAGALIATLALIHWIARWFA